MNFNIFRFRNCVFFINNQKITEIELVDQFKILTKTNKNVKSI